MENVIRYFVAPKPAKIGWYVKSVILVNGQEEIGKYSEYFRTKKEALEHSQNKNMEWPGWWMPGKP